MVHFIEVIPTFGRLATGIHRMPKCAGDSIGAAPTASPDGYMTLEKIGYSNQQTATTRDQRSGVLAGIKAKLSVSNCTGSFRPRPTAAF
jgi:hypothetical protein